MNKWYIAIATMIMASSLSAQPVTKKELNALIREYIINNPETIIESMSAYQAKQEKAGLETARKAIANHRDDIFSLSTDPAVGRADASATIVEFFDYNCSACKFMFKSIDAIRKDEGDDIRIIFKEYPIFGDVSQKLAKIGMALYAIAPDSYYAFHQKMMEHKGSATVAQAYAYAKQVGVAQQDIEKELAKPDYNRLLDEAAALGETLNIRGTPFLVVGDEPIPHAVNEAELRKRINAARDKS